MYPQIGKVYEIPQSDILSHLNVREKTAYGLAILGGFDLELDDRYRGLIIDGVMAKIVGKINHGEITTRRSPELEQFIEQHLKGTDLTRPLDENSVKKLIERIGVRSR